MSQGQGTVERIVMIGPSNIGDAVLASDVIAALHGEHPGAHLTLVVGARAQGLFQGDPRIHTLMNTDAYRDPVGRLRLALALWRFRPQLVIDLRHTFYPLLLTPASVWRYLWQPPRAMRHMRERHLWKLRAHTSRAPSFEEARAARPLWCSEKDEAHVAQLWKRWQLDGTSRCVIICPGAKTHIKRWTAAGFAALADRLIAEAGAQVIFSGEPDERPVVDEILGLMRRTAPSAVGLTTVRQLGALIQRARLVITNDSAALHLASALQVPTVAIFGPTDEQKYGPTAPRHRTVRRRLFCTPCERSLCRFSHECMRFISADEVFDAARELLG